MGKYIKKLNNKANIKHTCNAPISQWNYEPKGGFGTLWQCDCGQIWEIKQSTITEYVGKPGKPVKTWGKYGETEFGKRSTLKGV